MKLFRIALISITIAGAFFLMCSNPNGGTSDETILTTAKIYLPGGKPAQFARVGFYTVADTAQAARKEVYTDASGAYSVSSVEDGEYNLIARQDSLLCFQDSILISSGKALLRNDTLETGCTFKGVITLQPGSDPRNAVVHVLGTYFYANVDSSGGFAIAQMPSGMYRFMVSVANEAGYVPTYRTIDVDCSDSASLLDTIPVLFTGIPTVSGLTLRYDTLANIVALSWRPAAYKELREYIITRYLPGQVTMVADTSWAIADTCFFDTMRFSAIPPRTFDSVYGFDTAMFDLPQKRFEYRVAIRNKLLQTGSTYEFKIFVADHPRAAGLPFRRHGKYAYVNQPCTLTVVPCLAYGQSATYAWDMGSTGAFTTGAGASKAFTVPDTLAIDFPCAVKITTSNGRTFCDTLHIKPEHRWIKAGASGITGKAIKVVETQNTLYDFSRETDQIVSLWTSTDGISWSKTVDSLPFKPGDIVPYNGELWAIADTMNLWHSGDALHWQKIDGRRCLEKSPQFKAADLSPYGGPRLFSYKGKFFVVASFTDSAAIGTYSRFFQIMPDTSLRAIASTVPFSVPAIDWIVNNSDTLYIRATAAGMVMEKCLLRTTDLVNNENYSFSLFDKDTTVNEYEWINNAVVFRGRIFGFRSGELCCDSVSRYGKGYTLVSGMKTWINISEKPSGVPVGDYFSQSLVVLNGTLFSVGPNIYTFQ
jgi:hypothetical protein